jgi:hypothetical protein
MRWLMALPLLLAVLAPVRASAQDDQNDVPLGDVARNLRKKNATATPAEQVIDDDNLPKVMEQSETRHSVGAALKYMMNGQEKGFRVTTPDVTCSLSFTANSKSLLSNQYAQMELPPSELAKLEGPAVIEGDAFTVNLFNGTNWHLSELAVALTVVRKGASNGEFQEVRPEKKADVTTIYRIRAAASPWEKAIFSTPLKMALESGEEWHWAIVQAKGYPPDTYAGAAH